MCVCVLPTSTQKKVIIFTPVALFVCLSFHLSVYLLFSVCAHFFFSLFFINSFYFLLLFVSDSLFLLGERISLNGECVNLSLAMVGPTKVKASKSLLFTKDHSVDKRKNTC